MADTVNTGGIADPTGYAPSGPLEASPSGLYTELSKRREAFAAALEGVSLGTYDARIVEWLCGLDDPTCRTVVSLIWRVREVTQLRQDEDIRMARCAVCGHRAHPETPLECGWCPEGYCEAKP